MMQSINLLSKEGLSLKKKLKYIPVCYGILAAALYAVNYPFSKLLLGNIPDAAMAGILYIGAFLGLIIVSFIQKVIGRKMKEESLNKRDMPYVIGMVILDIAAPILLMMGLKTTSAANVSLLNNFEIVATSIIAMMIFNEKISKRAWLGIIFVTVSSLLLSIEDINSLSLCAGSIFVLGACLCWGFENNCTRMISNKNPLQIVKIKGFFSGCGSLIIAFLIGERIEVTWYIFAGLCLGFISYGLSILFYIYAQRELGAAKTSAYYAVSPFIGMTLSIVIFKEAVSLIFFIAVLVMILGTYFVTSDSKKHGHSFFHKHDGVYSIDLYAYSSKMRNMNPNLKIVFAISALIVCILADDIYVSLFISVTMGIITVFIGGVKIHDYISLLTIPIAFLIMGSIAIAIGFSAKPVGQYNLNLHMFYVYSSNESIIKTLEVIMKAFGAISALYMMTLSTNANEIISALRSIHAPKILIELMNLIYRFIFILIDVQCKMKNSAQSRLGYVDFKTSCYSFGSTAGNLLVVSMKKANAYYDAMEARCYDGEMSFLEEEKKIEIKHIAGIIAYFLCVVIVWMITK